MRNPYLHEYFQNVAFSFGDVSCLLNMLKCMIPYECKFYNKEVNFSHSSSWEDVVFKTTILIKNLGISEIWIISTDTRVAALASTPWNFEQMHWSSYLVIMNITLPEQKESSTTLIISRNPSLVFFRRKGTFGHIPLIHISFHIFCQFCPLA